jgi:hypothetical protein
MDKPTNPTGSDAAQYPWPENSSSETNFGATGVFSAVKPDEPPQKSAGAMPDAWANQTAEVQAPPPVPQPVPATKILAEPVVHKVVFGGSADNASDLLERMRLESAKPAPVAMSTPAPEPSRISANKPASAPAAQGSAGFTQLLRTLGNDAPAPAVAANQAPPPAQEGGFTSLLRAVGSPEASTTSPTKAPTQAWPVAQPISEEPRKVPSPGGFTELLRTMPAEGAGLSGVASAPVESKPGSFTQLFSTLEGDGANPSAPAPTASDKTDSTQASGGSFTRMLSLEQQSAPVGSGFHEDRRPASESLNYGQTPAPAAASGSAGSYGGPSANRDPFAPQPLSVAPPAQAAQGGSVGITRLIRMLDDPTMNQAPSVEPPPVSTPQGSAWTQTFATLSQPEQPSAPATKPPEWTPPQTPYSTAPVAVSGAAGPSEFTRILDASRIRELAIMGGQSAGATAPNQTPPVPAAAPPVMPSYSVPAPPVLTPPQMGGMQGLPHGGGYVPPQTPQIPSYPASYAPHPGSVSSPGAFAPPQAGVHAPQMPPVTSPAPAVSKLQQLVPLLLFVAIALMLALLVLLIFVLLKH